MRFHLLLAIPLVISACTPDPADRNSSGSDSGNVVSGVDGQITGNGDQSKFKVKCENRTTEQFLGKPDFASRGFPNTAPYTEKYCYLTYNKIPWDGPYTSINWRLDFEMGSSSGPNQDGSIAKPTPLLSIYNLNESTIRKGGVLMGIMGYWTGSDVIRSFDAAVEIKQGSKTYLVKYLISPIEDDYVSIPVEPTVENHCDEGVENICVSDGMGTYWGSLMPRSKSKGCSMVIPKFRVELSYCENQSPAKSCPAASVYCADLGPAKRAWRAKIQAEDCSEIADYPILPDLTCGI
ncbi:MAG: hypothetical protein EOP06_14205 [Proteobacteria bacterium]|nr:MAG: hypothetical protein EOP06_14205 [Pseudomonadota bacterium]